LLLSCVFSLPIILPNTVAPPSASAGALAAGTAAAGTTAAAAYHHAKDKEQRTLVLAAESLDVAAAWHRALTRELRFSATQTSASPPHSTRQPHRLGQSTSYSPVDGGMSGGGMSGGSVSGGSMSGGSVSGGGMSGGSVSGGLGVGWSGGNMSVEEDQKGAEPKALRPLTAEGNLRCLPG
jgi:uncharacterized membrane protein YgcG